MENPIEERKRMVQDRIEKSFNEGLNVQQEIEIEKAVYSDTPENRKLGRVGQEYGGKGSRGGKTDKPAVKKQTKEQETDSADKKEDYDRIGLLGRKLGVLLSGDAYYHHASSYSGNEQKKAKTEYNKLKKKYNLSDEEAKSIVKKYMDKINGK